MSKFFSKINLALATALGVGFIPAAPGTFGSAFALAVAVFIPAAVFASSWGLAALLIFALLTAFICGAAEKSLGHDAGSIVLDEVPLLIDLDRKHAAVLAVVLVLADRVLEALVDEPDAVLKNVREPDQQRQRKPALTELRREVVEIDAAVLRGVWTHLHVAARVDLEIRLTPALDLVELLTLLDAPAGGLTVAVHRTAAVAHQRPVRSLTAFCPRGPAVVAEAPGGGPMKSRLALAFIVCFSGFTCNPQEPPAAAHATTGEGSPAAEPAPASTEAGPVMRMPEIVAGSGGGGRTSKTVRARDAVLETPSQVCDAYTAQGVSASTSFAASRPDADIAAAAGFWEPQALIMFLRQRHGGVKTDDREFTSDM